jgi:hypothetical protein
VKAVPRIGRLLDLGGLLLFVVGGVTYARAWIGLSDVPEFERPEGASPYAATELADGYHQMERLGLALMIAALLVFVAAWWVARAVGRGPDAAGPASGL